MSSRGYCRSPWVVVTASGATAAVVGATWWWWCRRHWRRRSTDSFQDLPIPIPLQLPAVRELEQCPYHKELQCAIRLAYQAGLNMKGYLVAKGTVQESRLDLDMATKSNAVDFCTRIDVENESLIIQGIQDQFPTHAIIGEETVGTGSIPPLDIHTPTWIIDPIDGTTNFSQGLFLTCVSIAYCVQGKPVLGVVYAPATDEWYLAVSGYGAYRNGIRIEPQHHHSTPKSSLKEAVICCEFGYSRQSHEITAMLQAVSQILHHGCRGIRQLGSGVLDLCFVATGQLDIVYAGIVNEGWKPWDYAAGLVICQEAGCIMEAIHPTPGKKDFDLYGPSILCGTNRKLVDELRAILLGTPSN